MTAQIRPNRMEVSDRFPMLGFAVRAEEPNVEAEVVLAQLQGLQRPRFEKVTGADGHAAEHLVGLDPGVPGELPAAAYDSFVRDTVAFLEYVAEPTKAKRQALTRRLQAPLLKHLNHYLQLVMPGAGVVVDEALRPVSLRPAGSL